MLKKSVDDDLMFKLVEWKCQSVQNTMASGTTLKNITHSNATSEHTKRSSEQVAGNPEIFKRQWFALSSSYYHQSANPMGRYHQNCKPCGTLWMSIENLHPMTLKNRFPIIERMHVDKENRTKRIDVSLPS